MQQGFARAVSSRSRCGLSSEEMRGGEWGEDALSTAGASADGLRENVLSYQGEAALTLRPPGGGLFGSERDGVLHNGAQMPSPFFLLSKA